jgi:hypothetical protein
MAGNDRRVWSASVRECAVGAMRVSASHTPMQNPHGLSWLDGCSTPTAVTPLARPLRERRRLTPRLRPLLAARSKSVSTVRLGLVREPHSSRSLRCTLVATSKMRHLQHRDLLPTAAGAARASVSVAKPGCGIGAPGRVPRHRGSAPRLDPDVGAGDLGSSWQNERLGEPRSLWAPLG